MEVEGNSNDFVIWKNHNTENNNAGFLDVGGAVYVATASDTKKNSGKNS